LCNIPAELVYDKLSYLDETIYKNFRVKAVTFRAGRWGFGPAVALALCRLGYRFDTSVTPYVNWKGYKGPDFSGFGPDSFKFAFQGIEHKTESGTLTEIPVTIGFLHPRIVHLLRWMKTLKKSLARRPNTARILERLGLMDVVWLSPELSGSRDMIRLAKRTEKNNSSFLNLTFHSVSLQKGMSPFVKTKEDEARFIQKIECFLRFACEAGWQRMTLRELEKC
jgi:hypothetical protein